MFLVESHTLNSSSLDPFSPPRLAFEWKIGMTSLRPWGLHMRRKCAESKIQPFMRLKDRFGNSYGLSQISIASIAWQLFVCIFAFIEHRYASHMWNWICLSIHVFIYMYIYLFTYIKYLIVHLLASPLEDDFETTPSNVQKEGENEALEKVPIFTLMSESMLQLQVLEWMGNEVETERKPISGNWSNTYLPKTLWWNSPSWLFWVFYFEASWYSFWWIV